MSKRVELIMNPIVTVANVRNCNNRLASSRFRIETSTSNSLVEIFGPAFAGNAFRLLFKLYRPSLFYAKRQM